MTDKQLSLFTKEEDNSNTKELNLQYDHPCTPEAESKDSVYQFSATFSNNFKVLRASSACVVMSVVHSEKDIAELNL